MSYQILNAIVCKSGLVNKICLHLINLLIAAKLLKGYLKTIKKSIVNVIAPNIPNNLTFPMLEEQVMNF